MHLFRDCTNIFEHFICKSSFESTYDAATDRDLMIEGFMNNFMTLTTIHVDDFYIQTTHNINKHLCLVFLQRSNSNSCDNWTIDQLYIFTE